MNACVTVVAHHAGIIGADVLEVLLGDGVQAAGHCWRADRIVVGPASSLLRIGQDPPDELQVPVEAAHVHRVVFRVAILERLLVDGVDQRRHNGRVALLDLVEQRLDPALGDLDVRVEEDEHVAGRGTRARQPRTHQTLALVVANDFHSVVEVLLHIIVQWFQQVV